MRADVRQRVFELDLRESRNKELTIDDFAEKAPEPPMRDTRNIEEAGHCWTAEYVHLDAMSRLYLGSLFRGFESYLRVPLGLLLKPVIFPDTTNETMTTKE